MKLRILNVFVLFLLGTVAVVSLAQNRGAVRDRIQARRAQAQKDVETKKISGLDVAIWRPAQMRGQSPLIVFSHGFHGCKTQSTFLMEALADAGYLVVAPDHKDAACGSGGMLGKAEEPFRDPSAWSDKTYKDRGDDISKLLDAMRRDSQWRQIDWSNVGLAGHSLGGYTVLGLAGSWPGWKLNSIRAVLALSPYCEPYIFKGRLDKVGVPVMFQGGTRDLGITPSVKRSFGCYDKTPAPAYFVEFQAAGHFAWTDLVTDYQDLAEHYSVAFFDRYLRGTSVVPLTMRVSGVSDLRIK